MSLRRRKAPVALLFSGTEPLWWPRTPEAIEREIEARNFTNAQLSTLFFNTLQVWEKCEGSAFLSTDVYYNLNFFQDTVKFSLKRHTKKTLQKLITGQYMFCLLKQRLSNTHGISLKRKNCVLCGQKNWLH